MPEPSLVRISSVRTIPGHRDRASRRDRGGGHVHGVGGIAVLIGPDIIERVLGPGDAVIVMIGRQGGDPFIPGR